MYNQLPLSIRDDHEWRYFAAVDKDPQLIKRMGNASYMVEKEEREME